MRQATVRVMTFLPAAATGLRQDSKAQAEQVRMIAVERLGAVFGRAPADVVAPARRTFRMARPAIPTCRPEPSAMSLSMYRSR